MFAVTTGTVVGVLVGQLVEANVPALGWAFGMLPAFAVSWIVGLRLLTELNHEYRVSENAQAT